MMAQKNCRTNEPESH